MSSCSWQLSTPSRLQCQIAIDYSGSMSGEKIRSAVENVRNIFTTYVDDHDHIGLLRFNHRSDVLLGLTMKGGNEQLIDASFDQLLSPFGGTRLYNAIGMAYHQFGDAKSGAYKQSNDWVVVLTDGMSIAIYPSLHQSISSSMLLSGRNNDCCCFQTTMAALKSSINKSPVKLIVIGMGNDVHTDVLTDIANSASKGTHCRFILMIYLLLCLSIDDLPPPPLSIDDLPPPSPLSVYR